MIYYNSNTINDWNFGDDNIIKVYRNNAVCYYKITGGGDTPTAQTPCFAVVDDISQYSDTEFEDVYDKATEKWYKLNNLNQYEEYGIYGSGRTITYYDGKLTVDGDYEYMYSGGSWVNVGEVSGGTATLPDVPFTVNYNAKNYDTSTKTLLKTEGQLANVDAVITAGTPTVNDGYLTIASSTRATIEGYSTYFNRDNSNPNLTIISKQRTDGNNCHMFANRQSNYNWMYRPYSTRLTLHGGSETGGIAVTTQPVIESVRVDSSRNVKYNNYTDNTTSTTSSFNYGSTNSGKFALFAGYASNTGEWFVGDFYWVYMSQNTLTDDQVQQVIAYNECGGGQTEYPVYYDEMQDPPNNLSFSSMTEAEEYQCPWVGMSATIDGSGYTFSGDAISGYEWVVNPSRLPAGYTEVEYIENTSTAYINTGLQLCSATTNTFEVNAKVISSRIGTQGYQVVYACMSETGEPYQGFTARFPSSSINPSFIPAGDGTFTITNNSDGTKSIVASSTNGLTYSHTYPLVVCCGLDGNMQPFRYTDTKIYSLEVTLNGVQVGNYVPCKRDSDSKYGLYDLVSNTFLTSPNNTNFVGGNPV